MAKSARALAAQVSRPGSMPKVNIYVPDAMYDELRRRELPISQLAQRAFAHAIEQEANAEWIARARRRPIRACSISTEDLMSAVDSELEE
jgi:post-segregation antitoxin (ccd killing protein)